MIPRLLRIYCRGRRTYAIRAPWVNAPVDEWTCSACGERVKVAW